MTQYRQSATDPLNNLPPLLSIPQGAKILGISRASAYRYAATGDLPATRLGGRIYLNTAGLRKLLATEAVPA